MSQSSKILIVNTNVENIKFLDELLAKSGFLVFSAFNIEEAIRKAEEERVDVVIVDSSGDINVIDFLKSFRQELSGSFVPVVILIKTEDSETKSKAISLGVDCILRLPVDNDEVIAAANSLSAIKSLREEIERIEDVFYGLVKIIDSKDAYTKGHSERVTKMSKMLAQNLSLSPDKVRLIEKAAKLHDIGKIGVPENILNKPGALSKEEYEQIKMHPVISEKICSSLPSLQPVLGIIRHHHERYDGKGYPDGLKAEKIPLESRIISVVDCFDAMATDRPYRPRLPKERIIAIFEAGAGTQWDKEIVEVFLKMIRSNAFEKMALYSED